MANKEKAILFCSCSGACPSMEEIDFWELAEKLRFEFPDNFMAFHPRLCEGNGEKLMADLLKDDKDYITVACKEEKQEKLLKNGYEYANLKMERGGNFLPVSLSFKDTDTVFEEIKSIMNGTNKKAEGDN